MEALEAKSFEHAGVTPAVFFKEKSGSGAAKGVVYPESDGRPMADNTEQYRWIVLIKENLETLFEDSPDIFVAADLLWYPVADDTKTCAAPDVMVAFGRPKGRRGSYIQCEEDGIPPKWSLRSSHPRTHGPRWGGSLSFMTGTGSRSITSTIRTASRSTDGSRREGDFSPSETSGAGEVRGWGRPSRLERRVWASVIPRDRSSPRIRQKGERGKTTG